MAGRRPALTGKARDESGERERASPLPRDPVLERTDVPPDGQHTQRRTTSSHNAGATLSRSVVSAVDLLGIV